MSKALVYSRFDGRVSICYPMQSVLDTMMGRGGYWDDRPRSFLDELVYVKTSAELQCGRHISNDVAWRFVRAMQYGGLSLDEAYQVIAEHDCSRAGTMIELQDVDDFPDRWFRNAWRRSRNGGPPVVDLEKARPIQLGRIAADVEDRNRIVRRVSLRGLRPKIHVNWDKLSYAVNSARDEEELRKVWID